MRKSKIISVVWFGPLVTSAIFVLLFLPSCGQGNPTVTTQGDLQHAFNNNLIHESSPYLLQHAHNPVNWYPWGDEALQKAKDENKLLIISIGY